MRILIVGGTGVVGKSFADWASRGNEVERVILASRKPEQTAGLQFLNTVGRSSKVALVTIGTPEFWKHVWNVDVVIYGASSSDARDYKSSVSIFAADLENLRRYLAGHNAAIPLLYLSSGAVYGRQPASVDMVKEYQEPWPDDPGKALYAAIKRRAESYMLDYGNKKGCPVGVARIFAFCGAWLPTDQHFLIGNIIGAIEKNAPLEIKATVPVFRSYMSADSLSAALFELVSRLRTWQTVIVNVGSDRATEMHEFGIRLANDRRLACYSPDIGTLDLTRTDRYVPAISKLRDLTGLPQPVDLDVILSETLLHREQLALRPQ